MRIYRYNAKPNYYLPKQPFNNRLLFFIIMAVKLQ